MKKRIIPTILSAMLAIGSLGGCQQVPDGTIVYANGDVQLENAIMENAMEGELAGGYVAPESYEFSRIKDNISVTVDAKVSLPDTNQFATARLKQKDITQEQVEKIWDVLLEDTPMYLEGADRSKEMIQEEIELFQESLNDSKGDTYEKDQLKKWIKDLEEEYETAPEIPYGKEYIATKEFETFTVEYEEGSIEKNILHVRSKPEEGETKYLVIADNVASYNIYGEGTYIEVGMSSHAKAIIEKGFPVVESKVNEAEAIKIAEDVIEELDLDYLKVDAIEKTFDIVMNDEGESAKQCYEITFTRDLKGITEEIISLSELRDIDYDNAYAAEMDCYEPESITFIIDDEGVRFFEWKGQSELVEIVSENTRLLDFEDIIEIFESQVFLANAENKELVDVSEKNLTVDEVSLSMMTVRKNGVEDEYYQIPVWNFTGEYVTEYFETEESVGITSENREKLLQEMPDVLENQEKIVESTSILTINAIDGSVIDRTKGY